MSVVAPVLDILDADLENSLARLFELLRIPSISADPAHADDVRRAAEWLAADLKTIGFDAASVRDSPGSSDGGRARPTGPAGAPHMLFYGHYDVQPVDPLELWENDPFAPAVKDLGAGRRIITGRGAQDDKGQSMTFVEACRAWKRVHGTCPAASPCFSRARRNRARRRWCPSSRPMPRS